MSLPHVSLTPKNKLLHMSHIDSRAILVPVFSGEKNKINKHALLFFPHPISLSTPFFSALCWVCTLQVQNTVFLSLGSVSMSLHLICIRFSTLSGSYLIPTQYAARGNWVLRPKDREVFGSFLNSLQYSHVVSMELALQHKATEV